MAGFLNNRHHLPNYGVFASVDPLASPTNPATLNPYVYSQARPTAMSDRSGLRPDFDTPEQADDWFDMMNGRPSGGSSGHSSALSEAQRNLVYPNPNVLATALYECWYMGPNCEESLSSHHYSGGMIELTQMLLVGFAQRGVFDVDDDGFLISPYYPNNSQNVNFVVEIGPEGQIAVSVVQAPSATFKDMVSGGLKVIGLPLRVIELGGAISCAATAGGGCAVAGLAGGLATLADIGSAALTCSEGASTSCAWSVGTATLSATVSVGGVAFAQYFTRAEMAGTIGDMYRYGNLYATYAGDMFTAAGLAIVEQYDVEAGVHSVTVVL